MKRIICLLLTVCMLGATASTFAACTPVDESKVLRIELSNAGFGVGWADPLIEIFEAEHPGITVEKSYVTKQDSAMVDKVLSGTTDLDIIFPESNKVLSEASKKFVAGGVTYDSPFAELSDILDAPVPTDADQTRTMAEKMNDQWYEWQTTVLSDGTEKHYTVPWMQSPLGIVLNKNLYNEGTHGKLPNTTDELFEFCNTIKTTGAKPFIHALDTSYWGVMYDIWMYQYHGSDAMRQFWDGYAISGPAKGERYVSQMMADEGLLYALEVLAELLDPDNGYMHDLSRTNNFTQVQNYFLEPNKASGSVDVMMMPNGAWLEREMEANYDKGECNVEFIKMPIVSALGTKLGITDEELSAIIDFIDGTVTDEPAFTSTKSLSKAEVIAAVTDARNMTPSFNSYHAAIPVYSNQVELAKEFLQLMASDRGIEAMLRNCGSSAAYEYDIEGKTAAELGLSDFMYSVNVLAQKGYCFSRKDNIFTMGGLSLSYAGGASHVANFASLEDKKTAQQVFQENYNSLAGQWSSYMQYAQNNN